MKSQIFQGHIEVIVVYWLKLKMLLNHKTYLASRRLCSLNYLKRNVEVTQSLIAFVVYLSDLHVGLL